MFSIWKFLITPRPAGGLVKSIVTPSVFQPLHIGMQFGRLCVWSYVQTDAPHVLRTFWIMGTGDTCTTDDADYIGTVFDGRPSGEFVWHVFMVREVRPVRDVA